MNFLSNRWVLAVVCVVCAFELFGIADPVTDFLLGGGAAFHVYATLLSQDVYTPFLNRSDWYDTGFGAGMMMPPASLVIVPYSYLLQYRKP